MGTVTLSAGYYPELTQQVSRIPVEPLTKDATVLDLRDDAAMRLGMSSGRRDTREVAFVSSSCGIASDDIVTTFDHLVDREAQVREGLDVHFDERPRPFVASDGLR